MQHPHILYSNFPFSIYINQKVSYFIIEKLSAEISGTLKDKTSNGSGFFILDISSVVY